MILDKFLAILALIVIEGSFLLAAYRMGFKAGSPKINVETPKVYVKLEGEDDYNETEIEETDED